MTNLTQRIITGLVLLVGALFALTSLNQLVFMLLVGVIGAVIVYEYAMLTKVAILSIVMVAFVLLLYMGFGYYYSLVFVPDLLIFFIVVTLWWVANMVICIAYPKHNTLVNYPLFKSLNILLLLIPLLTILPYLHQYSTTLLGLLVVIVVSTDICSYIFGKIFGSHYPLIHLSPHKTTEGFVGGIIGGIILAFIYSYYMLPEQIIFYVVLATITSIFSIIGDLYQSVFKRISGVKNSSALLPGHGGIWDRLDGLLAATPVFMLGVLVGGL